MRQQHRAPRPRSMTADPVILRTLGCLEGFDSCFGASGVLPLRAQVVLDEGRKAHMFARFTQGGELTTRANPRGAQDNQVRGKCARSMPSRPLVLRVV